MPESSGGEKSLPASPRKIAKAREKGNVAKSQDLNAAGTPEVHGRGETGMGRSDKLERIEIDIDHRQPQCVRARTKCGFDL